MQRFFSFFKTTYFLLFLLILFAGFFRLYRLETFPVGFHIDEAIIGDTAYSLLVTGKDYDGRIFPLNVEVFQDYIPAGYHYLAILPVKILGLTIFATRLPGALIGSLMVVPVYFLSSLLFKKRMGALLSALLLALSPWQIIFSRATSETLVSLFFMLCGFTLLLFALEQKKLVLLFLATLSFGVSFFFYHTARVFVPLLFLGTLLIYFFPYTKVKKSFVGFYIGSFLFLSILSFCLVFIFGGGTNRFTQTSIFTTPETMLVMGEQIREDGVLQTPARISHLFHNKPLNYSLTFLSNYFAYFDGNFLFISGGKPIIFTIPNMGLLYLVEAPFLLLGFFYLAKGKNRLFSLVLLWILLSPVVASLTVDDIPNIRRAIVLFPMLDMVSIYGFVVLVEKLKGKMKLFFILLVGCFFLFNVGYFFHQYFTHTLIHRPWERNNGFGEMTAAIQKQVPNYERIVITRSKGTIWPLIVFYTHYNPKTYQAEGATKDNPYTGFGKYFFVPEVCPSLVQDPRYPKGKLLFVEHGEICKKQLPGKTYQFIYRGDGTKAFRLVY